MDVLEFPLTSAATVGPVNAHLLPETGLSKLVATWRFRPYWLAQGHRGTLWQTWKYNLVFLTSVPMFKRLDPLILISL